ncbi:MAG: hypothetical protein ACM3NQ_05840 [Bacteroidales bacterium]
MSTKPGSGRTFVSSTLLALGVLIAVLGVLLLEARQTLLTPDGLARRAGVALADRRVSTFVADRATSALLAEQPDLTAYRPVIAAVASGAVSSYAFQRAAQAGIRTTAAAVLSERTGRVAMSIPDLGVLLRSAVAQANPSLADRIPTRVRGAIAHVGEGRASRAVVDLLRLSKRLVAFAVLLLALGVSCIAAGVAFARDRRLALLDASVNLVAAAVVVLVLRAAAGWFLQASVADPLARDAVAGAWSAFTGGFRAWALALALAGLVIAASAQSVLDRVSIAGTAARAWRFVDDPPGGAWGRLASGLLLVAVGVATMSNPARAVEWAVVVVAGACVFIGVRQILALLRTKLTAGETESVRQASGGGLRRVSVVAVLTTLLAVGAIVLLRPAPPAIARVSGVCNGAAALCDRRLDQVTFAGAHNAMSAADVPGWMFPQQERGVAGQLADGIRAFLIDVHYGRPAGGSVLTDLDAETKWREKIAEAVGPEGMDAALRIRGRLAGAEPGPRGLYLCHGFCELGAQALEPWLSTLADFLVQNPDEVVLLVVEDYVTPQDLAAEFERAGLANLVYRGGGQAPWPTLQTLIDTRQRVVVMTESGRPGVPWILPAFDVMQETPYKFRNPAEMTCAVNRGGTRGSLFQINNWIETAPAPKPSNAAIVNAHDALLARARLCAQERGLRPTIIAVDFYRTGDVVGVVRALNQ